MILPIVTAVAREVWTVGLRLAVEIGHPMADDLRDRLRPQR